MSDDLPVYIVHDPKLLDRMNNVKLVLSHVLGNMDFVQHVADRFTMNEVQESGLLEKVLGRSCVSQHDDPHHLQKFPINLRSVSSSLNHLDAMVSISLSNEKLGLILEDDCVIASWSKHVLHTVLASLPADFDIIELGGDKRRPANRNEFVSLHRSKTDAKHPMDVSAYILSAHAAKALSDNYLPFRTGHDVHMAYLIQKLGLRVYHVGNSVFFDGSKTGDYIGTIYPEDYDLSQNSSFMAIKSIVDDPHPPHQELSRVLHYVQNTEHNNPQFRFLIARFYKKVGDYVNSQLHFEYCMTCFEHLFINVWKLREFLLEDIHVHKLSALKLQLALM